MMAFAVSTMNAQAVVAAPQAKKECCKDHKDGKACDKPADQQCPECKEKAAAPKHECKKDGDHKCDKPAAPKHECKKDGDHKCDKPAAPKHECKKDGDHKCDKPADKQCADCKEKAKDK